MLQVSNLDIGYKAALLKNLNFTLQAGEILFLAGSNGSGKSTLLKTLAKNLNPLSGEMKNSNPTPLLLSSDLEIQAGLTGKDIFDLFDVHASPWKETSWLKKFEIENLLNNPFETLSSGEKQRVLLCAGLFYKSDIILFDEPLSYLDWNFYFVFQNALKEYLAKGRTFVIANHDLNFSLQFKASKTLLLIPTESSFIDQTEKVLNDKRLESLFNIHTEVLDRGGNKTLLLNSKI